MSVFFVFQPNNVESDLSVQGLPKTDPSTFNQPQLNTGELAPAQSQNNFQQQQFRGNFRQAPQPQQQQRQFGRLQAAAPQRQQPQQRPFAQRQPEFGRLIQAAPQFQQRQLFSRQEVAPAAGEPAQKYGPPQQYGPPPPNQQAPEPEPQEPEREDEETEEVEDVELDQPSIAVSNAASGQYYILASDNTLQKVVFMTSQTEDDRRNNGFSAQLRYSPVAPIRDPIYAYNQQGQLVKLYNKK